MPFIQISVNKNEAYIVGLHGNMKLGRSETVEVSVADELLSREHIQFIRSGRGYKVSDLDSLNGVILNGAPLSNELDTLLKNGDQLELGHTQIQYSSDDVPEAYVGTERQGTKATADGQPLPGEHRFYTAVQDYGARLAHFNDPSQIADLWAMGCDGVRLILNAEQVALLKIDNNGPIAANTTTFLGSSGTTISRIMQQIDWEYVKKSFTKKELVLFETAEAAGAYRACMPILRTESCTYLVYVLQFIVAVPDDSVFGAAGFFATNFIRQAQLIQKPTTSENSSGSAQTPVEAHEIQSGESDTKLTQSKSLPSEMQFGTIHSTSPSMVALLDSAKTVAQHQVTVLIVGETGVGKEVLAKNIHEQSARAQGRFIAVNCAAISDSLIEGELFGYVKGAFTGADSDHDGLFRAANGGTLFLDEIGEVSLDMQVKLLRAIQEKEVRPVGGTKSFRVDVRILTATHRDLKTLSSEGKFREDLYFRLAGYELHVPSLRERTQDLKALCHNILENLAKEMGSKKPHLSAKAFECLGRYSFPGNIRDLQNILQWSLLKIGDSKKIDVAHLPPKVSVPEEGDDRVMPLKVAVDAFESDFIRAALERRNGNQSKTARDLGMSRRTLINKMTRYAMT